MTKQSPTVIFFGSGPVAAESLRLLAQDFTIEAVVTKPVPEHHRGTAPVIELAKELNLPYVTPANKKELTTLFVRKPFESSIGIVIDYGIIIEQPVLDYFPFGIINSHFSLLPEWRGADPITFSILSGQAETGVSLMRIVAALDEGPVLAQEKLVIQPADTSQSLTQKLIQLSHTMLVQYLPGYIEGSLKLREQTGTPSYSRQLTKQDGVVDWTKPAEQLEREVRAYLEWPKSRAQFGPYTVILKEVDVMDTSGTPGTTFVEKNTLIVYCGKKALSIKRLQPENKKEMPVEAFLRGYTL